jgi:hypothetical protein
MHAPACPQLNPYLCRRDVCHPEPTVSKLGICLEEDRDRGDGRSSERRGDVENAENENVNDFWPHQRTCEQKESYTHVHAYCMHIHMHSQRVLTKLRHCVYGPGYSSGVWRTIFSFLPSPRRA